MLRLIQWTGCALNESSDIDGIGLKMKTLVARIRQVPIRSTHGYQYGYGYRVPGNQHYGYPGIDISNWVRVRVRVRVRVLPTSLQSCGVQKYVYCNYLGFFDTFILISL